MITCHSEPRRAIAIYDEVLRRLAEVKNNSRARREEVRALVWSTYPLRQIGRFGEAGKLLDTAFFRLNELKLYPAEQVELGSEPDDALRALAEYEAGSGNVQRGIEIYQQLLRQIMASQPKPESDLADATSFSNLYAALAALHRRARQVGVGMEVEARRLELWKQWASKLPNNSFVLRQIAANPKHSPCSPKDSLRSRSFLPMPARSSHRTAPRTHLLHKRLRHTTSMRSQSFGTASRRQFLLASMPAMLPSVVRGGRSRPNVIVILADDLGFADVGFNGCRDYDTPNIDALAASGVTFRNAYVTHPYCSPSRAGILTGRYQQRFGHEANPGDSDDDVNVVGTVTAEVLLSDVLRKSGHRTAAIGKWHLGDAPQFLPQRRGFDEFFGFSGGTHNYYKPDGNAAIRNPVLHNGEPVRPSAVSYLTDDFTNAAIDFIGRNRANPFFLYLAYNAVHAPNQAPRKYLDRTRHIEYGARSVYAAMAVAMDDGIGRVIRSLEKNQVRENTLVFFLSDNGGRRDVADNRPLRGHKGVVYDGGVRVPFLCNWPGRLPAGSIYDSPVSSLDIFPTAMTAAGAGPSFGKPLDGVDLMPYVTGAKRYPPHETLYWRVLGGQGWAVRHGSYKLVKRAATDQMELFDMKADPNERRDIAARRPEVVAELKQLYRRWNSQMVPPRWNDSHGAHVKQEYDEVVGARTKALPPPAGDSLRE